MDAELRQMNLDLVRLHLGELREQFRRARMELGDMHRSTHELAAAVAKTQALLDAVSRLSTFSEAA